MSLNFVSISLQGQRPPSSLGVFRFPGGRLTNLVAGDRILRVTLDPALAQQAGPNKFYWDVRPAGRGMGLLSPRQAEENNGRLAVDLSTQIVTQISNSGTYFSGRYMNPEEVTLFAGFLSR